MICIKMVEETDTYTYIQGVLNIKTRTCESQKEKQKITYLFMLPLPYKGIIQNVCYNNASIVSSTILVIFNILHH